MADKLLTATAASVWLTLPFLVAATFVQPAYATIKVQNWGKTPGRQIVHVYTLANHRITVRISTLGAAIIGLSVPDRHGHKDDIVRGFDSLAGYLKGSNSHIGATIGRFANRIKGGRFVLDGVEYRLVPNAQGNYINGGQIGFDKRVWAAHIVAGKNPTLRLTYTSLDGEMNMPGTLRVAVIYRLNGNGLEIDYRAKTDKPTVLNLTNHAYFNLSGQSHESLSGQRLTINADHITVSDADGTPNGQTKTVAGGPFDFRSPTEIIARIDDRDPQIAQQHGYDQNFILNGLSGTLRWAARLEDPRSGRTMIVLTTQPGLELFTANSAKPIPGKGGALYVRHGALCLETQHFPNAPNIQSFPSTVLRPGSQYRERTILAFGTWAAAR